MNTTTDISKEKLATDLKIVISDAEELLRATAGQAGDKVAELRGKMQDRLNNARVTLAKAQDAVVDKAKQVGNATDDYVHDNPWKSVSIAAGVGLLVGILIGRR
ncbi:putative Protein ElaB [Georgfuchsia toluolica]|uniref:DUF883 domain-containing protein n=1 Tax=Georgfuchsia toluolica TaxID=424218 RepID=A0A916J630_9PROT|nr:DUF883 family protein [Georgfuchsia toluolica]CAG4884626.1 putative Protein ElaB [Georgfuchsia toluolica]